MNETRLPNLQILLAVLFSAAAIFAPLLMTRGGLVIGVLLGLGLLLGLVTLAVGYRAAVQKRAVQYPFFGWSLWLLKRLAGESQVETLERAPRTGGARDRGLRTRGVRDHRPAKHGNLRLIGSLNLALGVLIVLAVLAAGVTLVL